MFHVEQFKKSTATSLRGHSPPSLRAKRSNLKREIRVNMDEMFL